jgi:nitrite reductase/ring-hydroxylating ferredoxin subunit
MASTTVARVTRSVSEGIDRQQWLDPLAARLQKGLSVLMEARGGSARGAKTFLNGPWLGHPLHPALSDAPIGAWLTGMLLDVLGARRGADAAIAAGVVCAVPTALAGVADWHDTYGRDRRVGLVHALLNTAGLGFFIGSVLARRAGRRGLGVGLSTAGLALATGGAYLGGELVFGQGTGVRHNAWDPAVEDWQVAGSAEDLADGKLIGVQATVEGQPVPVVLLKQGNRIHALNGRCAHAGGPLAEGALVEAICVECPWHGSRFDMRDGRVMQGPSAYPQPRFEARVRDGNIEVRASR